MAPHTKFPPSPERSAYASVADLAAHFGASPDSIWRWTRTGNFPEPLKLSPQMTRWRWADVETWEAARRTA